MFKSFHTDPSPVIVQSNDCPPPPTVRYRMNDFQYTHPLLLADRLTESTEMAALKNEVAMMISQRKQAGVIDEASVYIRDLNSGNWIDINPGLKLNPGSLIKVPIMMTYLRDAEKNPALLNKKFTLDASVKVPHQTYEGDRIIPGKAYTIKELIYFMVVKSDNYATFLLNQNVNQEAFKKLLVDIGMPEPDMHDPDYSISASDYSKFLRLLYNATYLSDVDAEYALSLLVQCDFKDGMIKQLPPDVKVAHKFGENGKADDPTNHQLHESGIVYLQNNPYLISIMTKGRNVQPLPQVISDISKLVYDRMAVKQPKS
jgi:beta-lactamase class A